MKYVQLSSNQQVTLNVICKSLILKEACYGGMDVYEIALCVLGAPSSAAIE